MRCLVALALLFAPMAAAAEGTITVRGAGQAEVAPDVAQIFVAVVLTERDAADAMAGAAARMAEVLQALDDAGIAEEDIRTSQISLSPLRQRSDSLVSQGEPRVAGFEVRAGLSVTLRDVATVGEILDVAVDAGATEIGGISFAREDISAALAEARRAAVLDARLRAETYAAAAGLALGEVLELREDGAAAPFQAFEAAEFSRAAVPVRPGDVEITAGVTVRYALEEN